MLITLIHHLEVFELLSNLLFCSYLESEFTYKEKSVTQKFTASTD